MPQNNCATKVLALKSSSGNYWSVQAVQPVFHNKRGTTTKSPHTTIQRSSRSPQLEKSPWKKKQWRCSTKINIVFLIKKKSVLKCINFVGKTKSGRFRCHLHNTRKADYFTSALMHDQWWKAREVGGRRKGRKEELKKGICLFKKKYQTVWQFWSDPTSQR